MTAARSPGRGAVVVPRQPTLAQRGLAAFLHAIVVSWANTLQWRLSDPHRVHPVIQKRSVIYATWHDRLAFGLVTHGRLIRNAQPPRRMAALVSASRDGALLAAILSSFRVQPVRGSSSRRGPQALRELVTWAEQGFDIAITPDGPRGPRHRAQAGAVALASLTGLPILPVNCNSRRRWELPSWDRFQLPKPFTPLQVRLSNLLEIPKDSSDDTLEAGRIELEQRLLECAEWGPDEPMPGLQSAPKG